ncbi:MAG: hypothetical protein BMS9Abin36_1088 [Gammaproteobacteria bacterium]|nr:MAG: hypothetical protein BMS9Abin36_1088 [Gammaproteobacteria bacterium]
MPHSLRTPLLIISAFLLLNGCAGMMTSAALGLANNLSSAIMNQDDPQTVADGAPSYLLLLDSLIEGDASNPRALLAGARLYIAYASVFVQEPERAQRMSTRAKGYATQAVCLTHKNFCQALDKPFDQFQKTLRDWSKDDVADLYGFTVAWAGWLQANKEDWNAIADLPKIKACMERVVALDNDHDQGGAHHYLGLMTTFLPPALGGKPELGRKHFEKAVALSHGKNLMTQVHFAENYARLVFNQELHDKLLNNVLKADPKQPGFTLFNVLAQKRARELLANAKEYF